MWGASYLWFIWEPCERLDACTPSVITAPLLSALLDSGRSTHALQHADFFSLANCFYWLGVKICTMKLKTAPTHTHIYTHACTLPPPPLKTCQPHIQITNYCNKKATHKLCLLCMHYASARVGNPAESYLCQYQPNLALWSTHSFSNASG